MWPFKKKDAGAADDLQVGSRQGVLSTALRRQLYSELHLYLKNNHKLDVALTEIYNIYSDDGKKPRNKVALMMKEILTGMAGGFSFANSLAPYIPEGEFFLISAGEKSSYLKESMMQATRLIKSKQRLAASNRKAFAYNTLLGLMMVAVLVASAFFLIPQSMIMVKPEQLTGFAYGVYAMSEFVVHFGVYVLVLVIALIYLIRWAQPNYTGRHRVLLDHVWPFSLYRTVNGATFLISLSALMQANVQTGDALKELSENASPYIKQRILAARSGLHHGQGLGESLHMSGYQFPDPGAIRHLRILGSKSGVEVAISNFADDWLEESVVKFDAVAEVVKNVGMILVFLVAGVVVAGTAMIQKASQSAMGIM
ncbi:type II secretion system F family protein [Castellaniella sp.]|uniref:type II secretion system F family protein n=1 Tax=Castellaniella sp. TaxID=1955812 RepID=UPI002AFFF6DF|nr:type II secretion system F family protein [Castellaniella sp.]